MSDRGPYKLSRHYRLLIDAIKRSTQVVLYQGCPRSDYPQPEQPVITFDSYQFYQQPLPLEQAVAATLTALCCDSSHFHLDDNLFSPCAFHEDYCLEWTHGDEASQMLFCFSCGLVYGRHATERDYFIMKSRKTFQPFFPPNRWALEEDEAESD